MRILITGAGGFLGSHIVRALAAAGHQVFATVRDQPAGRGDGVAFRRVELSHGAEIDHAMRWANPQAVVHAAAMPDIRHCEREPELARLVNTDATVHLAGLCGAGGIRLLFFSTDQMFDGSAAPYKEGAAATPLHVYGRTKAEAEQAVLNSGANATVLRVSIVYGRSPSGTRSCTEQIVNTLRDGRPLDLFTDEVRTPILAEDVASIVAELIHMRDVPIVNIGGPESVSRYELGTRTARAFGLPADRIRALRQRDVDLQPPRPPDLTLDTALLRSLVKVPPRPLDEGLQLLAAHEVCR